MIFIIVRGEILYDLIWCNSKHRFFTFFEVVAMMIKLQIPTVCKRKIPIVTNYR